MFTKANCPQAIRHCAEMFSKLVQPQSRNSLAIDMQLSAHELCLALAQKQPGKSVPTTAVRLTHYTHDGVNYSIEDIHKGNSGVLYKDSEGLYCIEQILAFPEDVMNRSIQRMWLVVQRHRSPDIRVDPYGRYLLL